MTWITAILQLFQQKGQLTSQELAVVAGKNVGGDAVTRCRQLGLPLETAGLLDGSRLPRKVYTLNTNLLWIALQEAVQQINRYALLINSREGCSDCLTSRNLAQWMEHVNGIQKLKPTVPSQKAKLKLRI